MPVESAQTALRLAKQLQAEASTSYVPPSSGTLPRSQQILPHALVSDTRGYVEKIVFQINGCYESGWFDACAVMMRRLLEILIIECFEANKIENRIKDGNGDYYLLGKLVKRTLDESTWNLGRQTKSALPKLKNIGDRSAHGRRYAAHREDIDKISINFRVVCQELLSLSKLK